LASASAGVTSIIVGGRTKELFVDNLAAGDLRLTADDLARLDRVSRPALAVRDSPAVSVAEATTADLCPE
jgi:aryl-alcohol dehydrogenase-like predicted oxidoreductase